MSFKPFKWIGDFFSHIFKSSTEKLWNSLSDEEKANFKYGTGIIAIINNHIGEVPQVVEDAIKAEFPTEDIDKVESELITVCNVLGLSVGEGTILDAIAAIQLYLSTHKFWEWASSAVAELITVIRMPNSTIFAKVSMLIEYAYRTYFAKS